MKLALLLFSLSVATASYAATFRSANCTDSDLLNFTWDILVKAEPKIEKFLGEMGRATGDYGPEVKVTNCRVTWPVNESGTPIDGIRVVIVDKFWYAPNQPPNEPQRASHQGMKIIYQKISETTRNEDGGSTTRIQRPILGLVFCSTPSVCSNLNIPFPEAPRTQPKSETSIRIDKGITKKEARIPESENSAS